MTTHELIHLINFIFDRFTGHEIAEDLLEAAIYDWRSRGNT